jgi:hypothetical protein
MFARYFLLSLLVKLCLGHATIINPAFRFNPTVSDGWCAWCQGSQIECQNQAFCPVPTPCWGAPGPTTVAAKYFSGFQNTKDKNGNYWIDQTGGNDTVPVWCPSQTISFNTFLNADHNGIFQFQLAPGKPGEEKEELFKPFTQWKSINNDANTTYYAQDGVTPLKPGMCAQNVPWSPSVGHCRDNSYYQSTFTLPASAAPGPSILRWIWYGAMTVDGKRVVGPEDSLFVNCKDIIIGTPAQCAVLTAQK